MKLPSQPSCSGTRLKIRFEQTQRKLNRKYFGIYRCVKAVYDTKIIFKTATVIQIQGARSLQCPNIYDGRFAINTVYFSHSPSSTFPFKAVFLKRDQTASSNKNIGKAKKRRNFPNAHRPSFFQNVFFEKIQDDDKVQTCSHVYSEISKLDAVVKLGLLENLTYLRRIR